jgi:hypothetical protein
MDSSLLSGLSAGGFGGVIIAVCIIVYKCCEKKKYKSHLGCIDFQVEADLNATGATAPHDMPKTPQTIPVLEAKRSSITILPLELKEKEEV